jgi:protein-S-isoprenylcysteine O-methyltransferase Ste14
VRESGLLLRETLGVQPLAYINPVARWIVDVPLIVFVLAEQRTRWRSLRNRGGSRRDGGSFFVIVVCIIAGVGGAAALAGGSAGTAIHVGRWPLVIAGAVLMWFGIALRQWAVSALGRFFTVDVRVAADQTVVDSGPFAWVRHPSYTRLLLTLIGFALALGNWLPLIGIVTRIRVEERALLHRRPLTRTAGNPPSVARTSPLR